MNKRKPEEKKGQRPFRRESDKDGRKKTVADRPRTGDKPKPSFRKDRKVNKETEEDAARPPSGRPSAYRPGGKTTAGKKKAPYRRAAGDKPKPSFRKDRKVNKETEEDAARPPSGRSFAYRPGGKTAAGKKKSPYRRAAGDKEAGRRTGSGYKKEKKPHKRQAEKAVRSASDEIRLNKYIAHAGLCSRRDADEFIVQGCVQVNGKICKVVGTKVKLSDNVTVNGQKIEPEPFHYILMNKPRDTITTTDDEKGRRTVMDLVEKDTGLRLYPVGRLDRNTTGLLLLTNDGDLANRLMHPSYKFPKVYEAETSRELTEEELKKLRAGVELEDGLAKAYRVSRHPYYTNIVVLSMHEGRNRMVRRMIESLGVEVNALERIAYGPLQKVKLRSGKWRPLRRHEINELRKMVRLLPFEHRIEKKRRR